MRGFASSRPFVLLPRSAVKPPLDELFQLAPIPTLVRPSSTSAPGWAVSAIQEARPQVARETWVAYERRLERARVPAPQRPDDHKWTRFHLDFYHTYGHPPRSPASLGPLLSQLAAKNQSVEQRHQAAEPTALLLGGATTCTTPMFKARSNRPPRKKPSPSASPAHLQTHLCESFAAGGLRPADDPKAAGAQ